ncbi:hypothetical protein LVJ94_12385 [Pendulispora rubella]|uniref:Uncharacterized protein n=1 Tax=Pendulispora rubella TaxID=2741070 RepID=A0ABZ2LE09_9BACT
MNLFENDGYKELAKRASFYYGDIPVLQTTAAKYDVGQTVTVKLAGGPALAKDWVGIYRAGQTPGAGTSATAWSYAQSAAGNFDFASLPKGFYFGGLFPQRRLFRAGESRRVPSGQSRRLVVGVGNVVSGRIAGHVPLCRRACDPQGLRCRGIDKAGVEVDFRPFVADQPFKVFLLGIFFADGKTQAHTFTGAPIWVHPEAFREPARADRLSLFPALFPPPSSLNEKPARWSGSLYIHAAIAASLLAFIAWAAITLMARRRTTSSHPA